MSNSALNSLYGKRRNSVELQSSGILRDQSKVAPALQGIGARLEKQIKRDRLSTNLDMRMDQDDLIRRGIMPVSDERQAPRIQGLAAKLERRMNTDRVGQLLLSRPSFGDVTKQGLGESFFPCFFLLTYGYYVWRQLVLALLQFVRCCCLVWLVVVRY